MRTFSLLLLTATVCTAAVTPPEQIKVPPGFKVELLREAGPREGSWICMTQDDQGRLYISPQNAIPESGFGKDAKWGGMWRVTLGTDGTDEPKGAQPGTIRNPQSAIRNWEKVPVPVGDAMGMLWAFDSLYVSGMGPQGRGIYRCTSSKHDDQLDTATLFKAIPSGAGEHGAHAIVLGPDKKLYIVNGNSTGILDGLAPDSPYRHWGEDDLLPRLKDPVATFFDKLKAPYGCVYRTDADGTKWELFAGGFRNPYDIAFNADGELFTYDSDMEWDRGLPWYRPTRILHVVPGGEYGFREGSAKWPAYFPDSLPAVADIGVGCPTGMKFGTDAKGWPEKYRRALFFHDWTYGRILAVHLHEKGASYTARNDLASYTYPRDAEVDAKGDVEVFLSGKGMPVTDLEFLRDGSMVFTVGGRGTAAALYRVSYAGKGEGDEESRIRATELLQRCERLAKEAGSIRRADAVALLEEGCFFWADYPDVGQSAMSLLDILRADDNLVVRSLANDAKETCLRAQNVRLKQPNKKPSRYKNEAAPPAIMRSADSVPSEKAWDNTIAPRFQRRFAEASLEGTVAEIPSNVQMIENKGDRFLDFAYFTLWENYELRWVKAGLHAGDPKNKTNAEIVGNLQFALAFACSADSSDQEELFEAVRIFPLASLPDDLKLLKLRVLELSFARQGRPAEAAAKAVMEELLAHYPVPPIPVKGATRARNPAAGAPVDAPACRLNRELCALLVWLSNPELGELNANLVGKKAEKPKTGGIQSPADSRFAEKGPESPSDFRNGQKSVTSAIADSDSGQKNVFLATADFSRRQKNDFPATSDFGGRQKNDFPVTSDFGGRQKNVFSATADFDSGQNNAFSATADFGSAQNNVFSAISDSDSGQTDVRTSSAAPNEDRRDLQKGAETAKKAPELPSEAPPVPARSRGALAPSSDNAGAVAPRLLGPVPNPGADIFPGRKGAAFHEELGRQVIEKTLALMDAAPSQEEQVWYALCLRWAHGWTPELRVRYFRWFHEKAARYSGGNSFAKFVEAIRADAASRVPEADRAALAQWLRPVASPVPAAVLKPRAFVKAWTLPELEAALDKLKDRQPDLVRGKDLYTQAQCAQCHLFRDAGGNVGPDLTAVAQRFGRHDILESITDPSKVVSEQYAMVTLTILDGKGGTAEVSGLVKEETSATITILTDPLAGKTWNLYKNVVVKREKATVSTMPPGLLYTLTAEEVADLLALFGAK